MMRRCGSLEGRKGKETQLKHVEVVTAGGTSQANQRDESTNGSTGHLLVSHNDRFCSGGLKLLCETLSEVLDC